ncbi:phage protein [Clostridioides difficile]|nr:phage protein [Clostridioides difficile]
MNENLSKEIKILGTIEVEEMKFHDIEGGFGVGKKLMSVKDIDEIHNGKLKDINKNINNNRKRFKDMINTLDLKVSDLKSLSLEMGYSNQSYANANNIYLLPERDYSKRLKILEGKQYEKIVDGYFSMRKELNNPLLSASKELQAIFMLDKKQEVLETKIESVNEKLENFMDDAPLFNIEFESIVKIVLWK